MKNNITALQHPTIQRKIRHAIWLAKLEAYAARRYDMQLHGIETRNNRGIQYVANRKGHNILRVDWYTIGGLWVYGDQSRNVTHLVKQALGI